MSRVTPKFEELRQTMMSYLVYLSFYINQRKIFESIQIDQCNIPPPEKNGYIKKNKITAPSDSIIDITLGDLFRGPNIRKKRKFVGCPNHASHPSTHSLLTKKCECGKSAPSYGLASTGNPVCCGECKEDGMVCVTMKEHVVEDENGVYVIKYKCIVCDVIIEREKLGLKPFGNQLAFNVLINGSVMHCMCFKDSFKITGCKSDRDAEQTFLLLYNRMRVIHDALELKKSEDEYSAIFRKTLQNFKYKFGYPIDKLALNKVFNSSKYKDDIHSSVCESTSQPCVNVKFKVDNSTAKHKKLVVFLDNEDINTEMVGGVKAKSDKDEFNIFMIFSSSEVIFTGKESEHMKSNYEFINRIVEENKDSITETIDTGAKISIADILRN